MPSRRVFLQAGLATAAVSLGPWEIGFPARRAFAADGPDSLAPSPALARRFVDPLPFPLPTLRSANHAQFPNVDYYEVTMREGAWRFSSQLPAAARTWGYWGTGPSAGKAGPVGIGYLGPTIEARRNRAVVVRFVNRLPNNHPLQGAIDPTIMGNGPGSPVGRSVPHLHGGFTPPQFDGHPKAWFAASGATGARYASLPGVPSSEALYWYTNRQAAAQLWYHDHAYGITRLNVYAGLAGLYLVRDDQDTGEANNPLRLPAGNYEVPLVLQDKSFNPDGSLFYPTTNGFQAVNPAYPHPTWVPEFFGDTPVVNATAYPFLAVEPRRYRLRIVNAAQARFFNLSLSSGLPLWVIGMEQGLLPRPARLDSLLLAPGERADVIVDFTNAPSDTVVTLRNDAPAPYPMGDAPAIPRLMQFKVTKRLVGVDQTLAPASLRLPAIESLPPSTRSRQIVLKELTDAFDQPVEVKINERNFDDPVEEQPRRGATETWQFINCTGDAHPMHMHLVGFRVLNRQHFAADRYWADYSTWVSAGRPTAGRGGLPGRSGDAGATPGGGVEGHGRGAPGGSAASGGDL